MTKILQGHYKHQSKTKEFLHLKNEKKAFYDNISKFLISKECGKFCPCSRCSLRKGVLSVHRCATQEETAVTAHSRSHLCRIQNSSSQIPNTSTQIPYTFNIRNTASQMPKSKVYIERSQMWDTGGATSAPYSRSHIYQTQNTFAKCNIPNTKKGANMAHSRTHTHMSQWVTLVCTCLSGEWKAERSSSDIMWHSITRRH